MVIYLRLTMPLSMPKRNRVRGHLVVVAVTLMSLVFLGQHVALSTAIWRNIGYRRLTRVVLASQTIGSVETVQTALQRSGAERGLGILAQMLGQTEQAINHFRAASPGDVISGYLLGLAVGAR